MDIYTICFVLRMNSLYAGIIPVLKIPFMGSKNVGMSCVMSNR